jgi:ABC-type uncharacterized transport system involved in gliding motility auxiliary subunit
MAKQKNQTPGGNFTIIPLIIAALALISTAGFAFVRGLLFLEIYTGATSETLNRGLLISGGIFVIALALYVILEPEKIRQMFTGRQARYGSNAIITALAFILILGFGNVLIYKNLFNIPQPWDWTADKANTLGESTLQTLASLPEPVTAVAFYSANLPTETAEELLKKFKSNSDGKFDYQFIDPDTNPVAAREAGITGDGKIMLVMGERKEIAAFATEDELTRSMIRLIDPKPRAVYFLTGHGEASLTSSEISFATAKQTLESKNYTVNSLNLLAENKIPEDALAIVIAGPMKPVSQQEVDLLKTYVDAGGALVVMENPSIFTEFGDSKDPLADYLASDWGITLNNDVIIDLTSQQPLNAVSYSASQHPITQNLTQNYLVFMPQARSISITDQPEGVTPTSLLQTAPNSWGEMNFTNAEGTQISQDPEDLPGPLTMAAVAENAATSARVVVFGNSLFASDQIFDAYGNGNLFINAVDWAAEQDDLIDLTPGNTPTERTFTPPDNIQWIVILLGNICLIPGLIVLAGITTWLARKRRG